jgi:tetratricopeptide (TPR) repeat protein
MKKAELLYNEKKYQEVLDMKFDLEKLDGDDFPQRDKIVFDSAVDETIRVLKEKKCSQALELANEYNITLSSEFDSEFFNCALNSGDLELAQSIANTYVDDKNISLRLKWLVDLLHVKFRLGKYKEVIELAKEIKTLSDVEQTSSYKKVIRELFDSYERVGDDVKMVDTISKIEKSFNLVYADIDRYVQMVDLALKLKDNAMLITYATKVIKLQEKANSYTQSPYIEFALSSAYNELDKKKDAIDTLLKLNNVKLSANKRSRQEYQLGSLYQDINDINRSKVYFNKSIKSDSKSAWAGLSKDALQLID